jgi:hypothetical protein
MFFLLVLSTKAEATKLRLGDDSHRARPRSKLGRDACTTQGPANASTTIAMNVSSSFSVGGDVGAA